MGDHWGEGGLTRQSRPGRQPLGVALSLTKGDAPADRVPPQFARNFRRVFRRRALTDRRQELASILWCEPLTVVRARPAFGANDVRRFFRRTYHSLPQSEKCTRSPPGCRRAATDMPTALRAPLPASSPKTSTIRSLKPLMTCGCCWKSGVALTMPRVLTRRYDLVEAARPRP